RGQRLVGQLRSPREAQRDFFVGTERGGLQRVGRLVGNGGLRVHPVDREQRLEARDVGDRVGDAGAIVIVVGESPVRLGPVERARERQLQPFRKRLIDI